VPVNGLHHVTAIASDPQRNIDFYVGLLGLRLIKRTVNFDDPATYHFYFGDAAGTPGTILTFFPWPGARRGERGAGEVESTAFAIPSGSVGYWLERLQASHVHAERAPDRWGEEVIRLVDPDGMLLELIGSKHRDEIQPWTKGSVPPEHSVYGLHSVSAAVENHEGTAALLTETFGYRFAQEIGNRFRFTAPGQPEPGKTIDLLWRPRTHAGRTAAGSVHHVAFRVPDDAQQSVWREKLVSLGYSVSPVMDRVYFRSIYFREPGGLLFEIATDPPGFTKDERIDQLGSSLRLPPWMEQARPQIERMLPEITTAAGLQVFAPEEGL
jgi:glyoxalase family protein